MWEKSFFLLLAVLSPRPECKGETWEKKSYRTKGFIGLFGEEERIKRDGRDLCLFCDGICTSLGLEKLNLLFIFGLRKPNWHPLSGGIVQVAESQFHNPTWWFHHSMILLVGLQGLGKIVKGSFNMFHRDRLYYVACLWPM